MSQLRNVLIEEYAQHYARVNENIDPLEVDARHFKSMDLMYTPLLKSLPVGSKVLDLGCGTGFLLNWLSRQPLIIPIGVDASRSQVEVARKGLPSIQIDCQDGLSYLQQHPNTFAGIFCTDLLEHIQGKDVCLEWLKAVLVALKPGGFFYCRVPNAANLTGCYSRYIDLTHEIAFTSSSLLQLLEASGLQNCRIESVRAANFSGSLRLFIEQLLHRSIFLICGQGRERVFTYNICAVGFKQEMM